MTNALIHAYLFENGQTARGIDYPQFTGWDPGQGRLWAHFDATHADTASVMTGSRARAGYTSAGSRKARRLG